MELSDDELKAIRDELKAKRESERCDVCGNHSPLYEYVGRFSGKQVRRDTCKACGAKACMNCSKRTPKDSRFCMHCGWTSDCPNCDSKLPDKAKFCPACGTARTEGRPAPAQTTTTRKAVDAASAAPRENTTEPPQPQPVTYRYYQVYARQGEMATGRSILANLLGEPALIKCMFELRDEANGTCIADIEFMVYAGRESIENLSGSDRSEAERALQALNQHITAQGGERIVNGHHWYSHRYRVS